MSQIILNWLNEQIQLSKRITNFEEDFNNGYLLGELLGKYNQQLNFSQFVNEDDKKSKLKNFQLLFDTFVSLKVTFNSSVANDIINRKTGVAKKLLYELKMNLQKTTSNAFTKMTKMTKTLSPLKKIKVSKDQFDKVQKQHFIKQLNELHPAQKTLNQQKLLKKFSDFHQKQISVNNQLSQKQHQNKLSEQKRFRQRQRQNLKKTADFRNEWERSNAEKWQANMTVRNMQNEKDTMFKTQMEQSKFQNKTMSELNAIKSLDKDINQFEKKFLKGANKKKNIIEDSDQSSEDQVDSNAMLEPELKKKQSKLASKLKFPSSSNPQMTLDSPSKKKKPTSQVPQQQKHQRQKKRRKMIVQQNKRYQLIQISRRQKYILSTIQQTSKQQKELEYEIWRVWQNKEVIKENKKLQQDKQKEKTQVRQINAKFKRDELLKTYREEHNAEVKQASTRQLKLTKDNLVAERKNVYGECKKIVEKFIEVSEKCFLAQQQKNQTQICESLLDHLFSEFVQSAQTTQQVAKLELSNYVHGKGDWNLPVKRKTQDQPTDPIQDNALPDKVTNNYTLGNILRQLYENKFKNNKSQNESNQAQRINAEYIFCLMGLEFSGKHLAAEALSKKHNFNIVEIEKLIFRKIQQYEEIKDKVSQISQTTKSVAELAYSGQDIPNDLIIQLVKEEVSKNPRTILLNFPTSYNQALSLTKILGNVQPSDFVKKSVLQQKIELFSRLVWPTESKIVPKPIQQCGIDLALWIDIQDKTSYDRFLGRRWIQNQIIHINDEIFDQVNLLQVKDKASPEIIRNFQKMIEKQKLQDFFNDFGIQIKPHQLKQVEQFREGQQNQRSLQLVQKKIAKSWSSVDGHCPIIELQNRVLKVFEDAMEMKELKRKQQKQNEARKKEQQVKRQQEEKIEQQTKKKCVASSQELIRSRLSQSLSSVSFDQSFVSQTVQVWQQIENSTVQSLIQVFTFLSNQDKQQQTYFSSAKSNFINLLTREDKKFSIVKGFQLNYNKFFDENKEMISQDYTKEELHQRVDDLEESLFDIIETKKQDAMDEKKNSMESGWVESQLQQFYNCVRILLQAELNRYNGSQKIIADFYSKKYAVPQLPYQQSSTQIAYDTSLEMITKEGTCPRLDKLVSQTLRLFNKEEEVVDDKNKKGGKAPPAKKDDKKAKKGEVEQVRQPTPQELQMKRSINIEKSIFRYRVAILSEFSSRKILSLAKANENLYKDLEAYYQYTYDIQNKCVFNLSKIFRSKIEREEKIQNEFVVNYVDIIENEMIRNFEKEKPVILPAKQQKSDVRLTVANIWDLIKFISNESQSSEKISTKRLIQLIRHLQNNHNQKEVLPSSWKTVPQRSIESFVAKLDSDNSGFAELWKIFIFVVMSNFTVPSGKELEGYFNDLTAFGTQRQISSQKFAKTRAWFDESYQQQQNVRTFDRNEQLKRILFFILKQNNGTTQYLNGERLINSLSLEWYVSRQSGKQGLTYHSLAFDL